MSATPRTDVLVLLQQLPDKRALLRFVLKDTGATQDFVLVNVEERLKSLKADLPVLLNRFREAIHPKDTVRLERERLTAAMDRLNALSYGLLALLLARAETASPGPKKRVTAQSFVRQLSAFLAPKLAIAGRSPGDPLVVEVSADDDLPLAWYLPVELLPIIHPTSARGKSRVRRTVRKEDFLGFLGMLAVITRRRRAASEVETDRRSKTPLSVAAYQGSKPLEGVKEQLAFFASRQDAFVVGPKAVWPWNASVGVDEAVKELAALLARTQSPAQGSVSRRPVLHFCCHYRSAGRDGPELGFAEDLRVVISDLRGVIAAPPFRDPSPRHASRPLVFINACESASWGGGHESLLQFLFDRGFCHVIGGETLLPDLVASAFAQRLYDYALAGHSIGIALWRSRRDLLEGYNNPGGLLYTFYGSPEIRIH